MLVACGWLMSPAASRAWRSSRAVLIRVHSPWPPRSCRPSSRKSALGDGRGDRDSHPRGPLSHCACYATPGRKHAERKVFFEGPHDHMAAASSAKPILLKDWNSHLGRGLDSGLCGGGADSRPDVATRLASRRSSWWIQVCAHAAARRAVGLCVAVGATTIGRSGVHK